jgi:amino acid transporter
LKGRSQLWSEVTMKLEEGALAGTLDTASEDHEASPSARVSFKRALHASDVFFICVLSTVNLNLLTTTASTGFRVFWLWLLAIPSFIIPQAIAVSEITQSDPGEGGLSSWSGRYLGRRVGFLSSWCYWLNNVPYVPSVVVYAVTTIIFVFPLLQSIGYHFHLILSLLLLWGIIVLSMVGVGAGTGRRVSVIGACSTFLIIASVVWISVHHSLNHHGDGLSGATLSGTWNLPALNLETTSVFGLICMSMIGVEIGSVFGSEISDARAVTAWAAVRSSAASLFCYVGATAALLLGMHGTPLSSSSGLLEYARLMIESPARNVVVILLDVFLCISLAGAALCWFGAASRMLWLCSLEGGLPRSWANLHPVWRTPHRAILMQGVLCSLVLVSCFLGSATQEAYLTLLDIAVIIQLLPYVAIFIGLFRHGVLRSSPQRWLFIVAGILGSAATTFGVTMAFVPSRLISNIWQHEIKLGVGCALCIGIGLWVFSRQQRVQPDELLGQR